MFTRTGFIVLGILIIIVPLAGLPGGVRDILVQVLGVGVLISALLIPREQKVLTTVERTNIPEVYPEERPE